MNKVSLVPYVCGAGASVPGSEQGPVYAYDHGLADKLSARGIQADWAFDPHQHWSGPYGRLAHENLPARGSDARHEIVSWHVRALEDAVATELERGRRVVTIGGDHSLAAGSIAGARRALGDGSRLGLLWIDAHPDLHTFESSVSKALHGMPMGTLTGLDRTLSAGGPVPVIRGEDVIFAGLRDIDPGEFENARKLGIRLMGMEELRARGVAQTLQEAVMALAVRCDHLLISVDLDGFSPAIAPAVGTPVPEGFMPDEILPTLAGIVRSHSVPLIDVVEFNPMLPGAAQTFEFLLRVIGDIVPKSRD